MTDEEFQRLLEEMPLRRIHAIAKGRIHRHFRMGKQRLIQVLLNLSPAHRSALAADIHSPIRTNKPVSHAKTPTSTRIKEQKPSPRGHAHQVRSENISSGPITTIEALLEGIGVPPSQPFHPDPWQIEAVTTLANSDVIVSVPTGSGKTYVAIEATKQAMERDRTVIYTSPLKALSNTKFMEFCQLFGADRVGILTGDRRDNAQAPLLIMTTEILRNLLYDAASGEIDVRLNTLGLVILDESQYLADPERGVVWEETIIFCPSQAQLLLLSASIGNPQEIADWLTSIRPSPCHLIHHQDRSVPLRGGFLHPSGKLCPLFRSKEISKGSGYTFHPETKQLFGQYESNTFGSRSRR